MTLSVWTLAQDRQRVAGAMNGIRHASGSQGHHTLRHIDLPTVAARLAEGGYRTRLVLSRLAPIAVERAS